MHVYVVFVSSVGSILNQVYMYFTFMLHVLFSVSPNSRTKHMPEAKTEAEPETEGKTEAEPESEGKTEAEPESEGKTEAEPETEGKTEAEPESEGKTEAEPESEGKTEAEPETEGKTEAEPETEGKTEGDQLWLAHLGLSFSDRSSLQGSAWLNDRQINASQTLLKNQYSYIGGLQNTLLGQNFSFVPETTEFVQVLHGAGHWLCVTTVGCKAGEVKVLDSLYSTVPTKVKRQIAVLTRTPSPQLKLIFVSVAQQRGGSDCGLYAIANAAAVCAGLDVTRLKYDQNKMRNHLMKCLEVGVMTLFPSMKRMEIDAVPHLQTEVVDLYCHCREPERGRMIQCKTCREWFHSQCVTVLRSQWKKPKLWLCTVCAE